MKSHFVNCSVLCRKLLASRSPASPTPAPFADLGLLIFFCWEAGQAGPCHPSQGHPVPEAAHDFPQETTPSHIQTPSWGGADPSGTREGPGQPEHCIPDSNGFRGVPEAQSEPVGYHLGAWWDSSARAVSFLLGFTLGLRGLICWWFSSPPLWRPTQVSISFWVPCEAPDDGGHPWRR